MTNIFNKGFSRRSFMRTLGAASAAATCLPALAALQQQKPNSGTSGGFNFASSDFGTPAADPNAVFLSANENPLGPSNSAREAIAKVDNQAGRYYRTYHLETIKVFSESVGLKQDYVQLYPGSTGPLDLALYSSLLNGKDLVVGDPSYEQGPAAGAKIKAKVHLVPLLPTGAYDIDEMLKVSDSIGAFYICNPNNPTGTMTPKSKIIRLVKNKPAGSVVIIDEAYHHFSTDESSIDLVGADQDVIVLRTFSKLYGMAGLRAGFLIAKPELQQKISLIGIAAGTGTGLASVSVWTAAACLASLKDPSLIAARRKINKDTRENVFEWLEKNGYSYLKGSRANCFLVDVKRPGKEFATQMAREHIYIGRTWPAMPSYSRITIGTQEEMDKFKVAFKKCYELAPLPVNAYIHLPDHHSELDFVRNV
jgi:histidinol-phosphate aminotransferase